MDIFDLLEMNNPKEILLNKELPNKIKSLQKQLKIKDFSTLHKEDINIDLNVLCDDEYECDEYIWIVRQCGTHIYPEKLLFAIDSQEHVSFKHFSKYERAIFKINIIKRDLKNKKVYGEIKPLDTNGFTKQVLTESKDYEYALCKVITSDGEVITETVNSKDSFKDSSIFVNTLKRNYEKIKKVYYLNYFNKMKFN